MPAEFWKTVRWLGSAAMVIAAFWLLIVQPLERTLGKTSAAVSRRLDQVLAAVTGTKTHVVEGKAELSEQHEISELALMELKMSATRRLENEKEIFKVLKGKKSIVVRGNYRIKLGYRLKPGVSLQAGQDEIIARFPRPEVLSAELLDFETLSEEQSWLNEIDAQDRALVLRELHEQMQREVEKSGILDSVDQSLRTRLKDLLATDRVRLEHDLP